MKKLAIVLLLSSTLSAVGFPLNSSAQQGGALIQAVLDGCPAGPFRSCAATFNAAIATVPPGAQRNADLVAASVALVEIARRPQTPFSMCMDIAGGIRVAGQAVSSPADSRALVELADALCMPGVETAAGAGVDDTGPPASLVSGSSGQSSAPPGNSSAPASGGSGSDGGGAGNGDSAGGGAGGDGGSGGSTGGGGDGGSGSAGDGGGVGGDGGSTGTEFDTDDGGGVPPDAD